LQEDTLVALETYKLMHAYEQAATPQRFKHLTTLCEAEVWLCVFLCV
jgi:hypothetical protein